MNSTELHEFLECLAMHRIKRLFEIDIGSVVETHFGVPPEREALGYGQLASNQG